jgi:hypothetical protein
LIESFSAFAHGTPPLGPDTLPFYGRNFGLVCQSCPGGVEEGDWNRENEAVVEKVQFLDFQLKWFMNALIEKVNSTGRPQHSVCFDTGQPNE